MEQEDQIKIGWSAAESNLTPEQINLLQRLPEFKGFPSMLNLYALESISPTEMQFKCVSTVDEKELTSTNEIVAFNSEDKDKYSVMEYDGKEEMAVITGYGMKVSFNMRLIHSLSDAESCANALADTFYKAWMEQILQERPELAPQTTMD